MFEKKKNKQEAAADVTKAEGREASQSPSASKPKSKKKRFKKRYIVFAAVAAVIALVVVTSRMSSNQPETVEVKTIGRGDLTQMLDLSGTVESEEVKTYYAKTSAQIESVNVELGSTIKTGENLLTYNVEKLEQAAKQAELETQASDYGIDATVTALNHSQQKASQAAKDYDEAVQYVNHYSSLVSSLKEQLRKASEVSAQVESLTAQLAEAQKKLEEKPTSEKRQNKVKELAEALKTANKEAAKYDVSQLNASLETCSADLSAYESLKSQYEAQKEADPSIGSQKSQQGVLREVNQLTKEQSEESLAAAREGVKAEFGGIVTAIGAAEGMTVPEGAELFTVSNDRKVKVTVEVTKYDLPKLQLNQHATITINNKDYEGYVAKISRFAHTTQSGASVLSADVHIDDPDDDIYLGIEGKVHIQTASVENVVLVPMECVNADAKGDFCYVVEDGVLVRKDVEIGIASDEYSEVLSGLEEGAQVVSVVTTDLTEGMNVVATENDAADGEKTGEAPEDAAADAADDAAETQ